MHAHAVAVLSGHSFADTNRPLAMATPTPAADFSSSTAYGVFGAEPPVPSPRELAHTKLVEAQRAYAALNAERAALPISSTCTDAYRALTVQLAVAKSRVAAAAAAIDALDRACSTVASGGSDADGSAISLADRMRRERQDGAARTFHAELYLNGKAPPRAAVPAVSASASAQSLMVFHAVEAAPESSVATRATLAPTSMPKTIAQPSVVAPAVSVFLAPDDARALGPAFAKKPPTAAQRARAEQRLAADALHDGSPFALLSHHGVAGNDC